jgi:hypothetical protein
MIRKMVLKLVVILNENWFWGELYNLNNKTVGIIRIKSRVFIEPKLL